jgi:PAS domain S-box-containing protein
MAAESRGTLDEEIARLREQLESAEEMRRAIIDEQIDGFVVGEDPTRVVLLEGRRLPGRALIEHLPHSVVTVSRAGEILYANERFGALVGHPLARLFSSSMLDLLAPHQHRAFQRFLAASLPDSDFDAELLHADGRTIRARATAMAVGNGYASLLVAERREPDQGEEAERALEAIRDGEIDGVVVGGEHVMLLAEAHRPYRALVDRMQQGAVAVSTDGDVLYANERFAAMVDQPRETLLGKRLASVLGMPAIGQLLMHDGAPTSIEFALARADGTTLPIALRVERVEGMAAVTLIADDLTERDLHRAIQERARRNDQFLAVLAHELRNPLGSIRNAVAMLERSGSNLNDSERTARAVIARQSETLVRLVDDLLDVHRLNEGKIVLQRKVVDVRAAIEDAVGAVRQAMQAKQQTVDINVPREPLFVEADPVRIAQVLGNLLLNASKFTGKGGHIHVEALRVDRGGSPIARIGVTDTGIGIARDQFDRIFEPYVQAASEASPFPEGLGLGLSVAKRLVDLHGGSIDAHSDGPGHGSTFTIELPACEPPAIAAAGNGEDLSQYARARILVADDDRDAAATLASLLQLMGHETHTANDGNAALSVAEAVRPDVAILDLRMPRMDGYRTAAALRRLPWASRLVLYALSGWGEAADRERTQRAGFDRHFVKPVDFDELIGDLRTRLGPDRRDPAAPGCAGNGADGAALERLPSASQSSTPEA